MQTTLIAAIETFYEVSADYVEDMRPYGGEWQCQFVIQSDDVRVELHIRDEDLTMFTRRLRWAADEIDKSVTEQIEAASD